MTLLIVSDSHGRYERLESLLEMHKNVDALIFLGDGLLDLDRAGVRDYPFTVFSVRGNWDSGRGSITAMRAKDEMTFTFEGIKFFALHGHTKGVKSTLVNAIYAAEQNEADVLLFGHTHEPLSLYLPEGDESFGFKIQKPLYLFNPGSIGGYERSFGCVTVDKNGGVLMSHGNLER